jgi:hypothetical protein
MSLNVLVFEVKLKDLKTRFINAYGLQECASRDEKSEFYFILKRRNLNIFGFWKKAMH